MMASLRSVWRDFRVQRRAVGAVMLREMVSRWGRRDLGFAWLFCEPLVFALPVITIWSYVRAPFEHGLPMVPFIWTGYMPLLVFRHVTAGALFTIRNNAALLYHRRVTPLDLFIGRQGLEALGNLAAGALSFILFVAIGVMSWPVDFNLMVWGFIYAAWWALCVAMILACLSERWEAVEHVWPPFSYLYIFFSGFFILADWLPPGLRSLALTVDPPMHTYEMVRGGMFGNQAMHPHYDIPYLTFLLAVLTLIALWLIHGVRKHIELR